MDRQMESKNEEVNGKLKSGRICNVSLISFHIQMRGVTERRGAVCKCQWNLKASQVEDGTRWLMADLRLM